MFAILGCLLQTVSTHWKQADSDLAFLLPAAIMGCRRAEPCRAAFDLGQMC